MMLRDNVLYVSSLLILFVGSAKFAQADPPAPSEPQETSARRPTSESAGYRDDPLGHVPPGIGGRIEEAIRATPADDQAEHHGLFGTRFHGCGPVTLEYLYVGEVFSNARGGRTTDHATRYEGLLDLAVLVDFEKTRLPVPGRFFLLGQNTHGEGLTGIVGDVQATSNIDTFGNMMQVSEYWWEVDLVAESLAFRLGKQDVNSEFLTVDMAGDFIHASFGISPQSAIPTFPAPTAGTLLLARLTDSVELNVGVWDGVPIKENWGFSGTGVTFTIGELEYEYALCDGKLPGVIDAGIAYLSSGEVAPGIVEPQSYGYYFDFEQTVYRENPRDEDDDQGLGVFAQYGSAEPKNVVTFLNYFGAGMVYKGALAGRDEDILGVGIARAGLSLGGTGRETVVEIFYKAHVTPWMTLQPDLQYVASPSGIHPDALAFGLRFGVLF